MAAQVKPRRRTRVANAFAAQMTWDTPRRGRKRGLVVVGATHEGKPLVHAASTQVRRWLSALNTVVAVSFCVGSVLFVVGALLAESPSSPQLASSVVYLCGGLLFTLGGWASFLQAVNARDLASSRAPAAGDARTWRWWSYDPRSIGWLSTFVLLVGTLVFGVSLVDAFLRHLSATGTDQLVWAPDAAGCVLFLISGHLALVEVCRGRAALLPANLGWWIVVLNQAGSVLFTVSAVAGYVCHATDRPLAAGLANWTTAAGAVCFCAAGVAQAFERPSGGSERRTG